MSVDDTMENIDDIFKQMNRSNIAKVLENEDSIEPRIVSQKEDLIYVKNPRGEWAQNRVLNIGGEGQASAVTLCLQEQQAIALILSKKHDTTLTDMQGIEQENQLRVKLHWGLN